ncbi:5-(carboxyamino)imidazole ribonucleotide mutase [bacterium]|nr:5-(carboxyamino)imidazole ribonucleotide mutase [bacterium]
MTENKVLILMGSESDSKIVESALPYYGYFGIAVDVMISSAHRHPEQTARLAADARKNGYSAIVCAAGMAAHLAGVCAAHSDLPIIGVPLAGGALDGMDALLSTVQMPSGIPVATLAIGKAGAINSAVFCARILSLNDSEIEKKLIDFRNSGSKLKG